MERKTKIDIIADNGGGITLQYHGRPKYLHYYYQGGVQVIDDLRAINDGHYPSSWDGNEYNPHDDSGRFMEYNPDMERNGGYRWYMGTAMDLLSEFGAMDLEDCWGYNVQELARAAKS